MIDKYHISVLCLYKVVLRLTHKYTKRTTMTTG